MSNSVDLKKLMNFLNENMNFEPGEFKDNAFEVKVNYKIDVSKMLEFLSTAINDDKEYVFKVSGQDIISAFNRNIKVDPDKIIKSEPIGVNQYGKVSDVTPLKDING